MNYFRDLLPQKKKTPDKRLEDNRRDVKKERRLVSDRRNGEDRRILQLSKIKYFFFDRRENNDDRRTGKDRRYGVDRRMFNIFNSSDTTKKTSPTVTEKQDTKLNITKKSDTVHIKKNVIKNSFSKILAYVYRHDPIDKNGNGNNFVEIPKNDFKDIKIRLNHPSGDAFLVYDHNDEYPLNIDKAYHEQINIIAKRNTVICINEDSIGRIKICSSNYLVTKKKLDFSIRRNKQAITTIELSNIGSNIEILPDGIFRFGKILLEIDHGSTVEISIDETEKCRISGPAGVVNLKNFVADLI